MSNGATASTAKRAGRVTLAVAIAGAVAHFTNDNKWLALAPALSALGKFLRTVFNLKFIPF